MPMHYISLTANIKVFEIYEFYVCFLKREESAGDFNITNRIEIDTIEKIVAIKMGGKQGDWR